MPQLSPEQTNECVLEAQSGSDAAVERLLLYFEPKIKQIARNNYITGADPEDVLQTARLGLWDAILRYNPRKRASFEYFARICIRRQIISAMKTARKRRNDPLNRGESLLTPIDTSDPEGLTVLDVTADEAVNIEKDVIVQEESKWLDETLKKRLTELERNTYERYKDGYTYREIAVELIRTEKTIDNAIMRVRNKAKEIIKQYIVNVLAKDDYSGAEYLSRKCGIENIDEIINVYCISFFSFSDKSKK